MSNPTTVAITGSPSIICPVASSWWPQQRHPTCPSRCSCLPTCNVKVTLSVSRATRPTKGCCKKSLARGHAGTFRSYRQGMTCISIRLMRWWQRGACPRRTIGLRSCSTSTRHASVGCCSPTATNERRDGNRRQARSSAPVKLAREPRHAGTYNTRPCGLTGCCWRTPLTQPARPVMSQQARQRPIAVFGSVVCCLAKRPPAKS